MGAVLAAGHGRRLAAPGSKALVSVADRPLLAWTLEALQVAGVSEVVCVTNTDAAAGVKCLVRRYEGCRLLVRDTESALATFQIALAELGDQAFIAVTVDAFIPAKEVKAVADVVRTTAAPLVVGIGDATTRDARPLRVRTGGAGEVLEMGDLASTFPVTAGIYGGRSARLPQPMDGHNGWGLRDYLRWLVQSGLEVLSVSVKSAIDIDTPDDLALAEQVARRRMV